jgi:hypothetical protein
MSAMFATKGCREMSMESVKRVWRTVMTGAVLGLLAAGTASSHVSVVERELRGKAFLNQTSALKGVDRRIALADGGQLVLAANGDTLNLSDRHGRSRPFPLLKTRINASLTLLPSGRVLVWGGSDASGAVQKGGLWFHPDKGEWQAADDLTPTARVGHTATVPVVWIGVRPSCGMSASIARWRCRATPLCRGWVIAPSYRTMAACESPVDTKWVAVPPLTTSHSIP